MNGKQYLKNQLPVILINLLGMLAFALFLIASDNPIQTVLFILAVWSIVLVLSLLTFYFSRKKYLNKLLNMTEQLEERYLLPEIMQVPERADEQVFYQIMKMAEKSMLERIGEVQREARRGQHAGDDPEAHDHLRLAPALLLEVVVQRRHEEDALLRLLVVEHLDHDGQGLGHEQASDDERHELGLREHGQAAQRHAQRERSGVAHEDVGRERVEPQEADARARERGGEDGGFQQIGTVRDGRHHDHHDHDRARRQTVQAVGEVHGVAHAHQQDVHEQQVQPGDGDAVADGNHRGQDAEVERHDEGNLHGGLYAQPVHGHEHERRGDGHLPHDLRLRGETERALLHHFRRVVDEAQQTREHGSRQQHERLGRGHADEQRHRDDRDQHDDAAHGGRALLHEVALGAVGAHLLADMARLEELDPQRREHHGHHHGEHDGKEHEKRRILVEYRKHS